MVTSDGKKFKAWTDSELTPTKVTLEFRTDSKNKLVAEAFGLEIAAETVIGIEANGLKQLDPDSYSPGGWGEGGEPGKKFAFFKLEVDREAYSVIRAKNGVLKMSFINWTAHFRNREINAEVPFPLSEEYRTYCQVQTKLWKERQEAKKAAAEAAAAQAAAAAKPNQQQQQDHGDVPMVEIAVATTAEKQIPTATKTTATTAVENKPNKETSLGTKSKLAKAKLPLTQKQQQQQYTPSADGQMPPPVGINQQAVQYNTGGATGGAQAYPPLPNPQQQFSANQYYPTPAGLPPLPPGYYYAPVNPPVTTQPMETSDPNKRS